MFLSESDRIYTYEEGDKLKDKFPQNQTKPYVPLSQNYNSPFNTLQQPTNKFEHLIAQLG